MSPKEKAQELVEKFTKYTSGGFKYSSFMKKKNAIQCAIIAVGEILAATETEIDRPDCGVIIIQDSFWNNVLSELRTLA